MKRFYDKVDSTGECHIWTAAKTSRGYGRLSAHMRKGKVQLAHRFAWELERGPIPPGACVCHSCDNPACVRVSHLFLGSQVDNIADMTRKGRAKPKRWPARRRSPSGEAKPGGR